MQGYALRPVAIAGTIGPRATIFASSVNDAFRASGGAGRAFLGQVTNDEWYAEAKRELTKYDSFVDRLRKVAARAVREDLAARYVGSPSNPDSGIYRRNAVLDDVNMAESYTPINTLVFAENRRRNRVRKLDEINNDFERAVRAAELQWGTLPEPQIVERIVQVQMPGAAAPATSPIVPIVVAGALAVAGLALFGAFD